MTSVAELQTDPVAAALTEITGDPVTARQILIRLGRAGFVVHPVEDAAHRVAFEDADVLVLTGYAAENPGLITSLVSRAGDKLVLALREGDDIRTLRDEEMEAAGWVRADRHIRVLEGVGTLKEQLREAKGDPKE